MEKFKWTEEKIELLRQYYPNTEWEELYKILGTDRKLSIMSMASKYKISRDLYNKCHRIQEQVDFVLENHDKMTATQMSKILNCSLSLIIYIAQDHNLIIKSRVLLKKEDEELFIELYPKYTNKYLSEKYFPYLTPGQINKTARKYHLVKSKEKSIKWYDKEDLLERLEIAIREHGRVPILAELQAWGLPSEKTFCRYFGGLTKACELIGIERPNYSKPIVSKEGVYYDNNHNVCLSKSEVVISNFLIEQNIDFTKESYYKDIIPYEECGNKRFDWKIGDKYIEFFGLDNYKDYNQKTERKIALCKKYNIDLLALRTKDLLSKKWKNKILEFLK